MWYKPPKIFDTERQAASYAEKCGMPNSIYKGVKANEEGKWNPMVVLRSDQTWARSRIEERGVLTEDLT